LPRSPPSDWQPTLSIRWAHLPYRVPASLMRLGSGAGISHLLAIASPARTRKHSSEPAPPTEPGFSPVAWDYLRVSNELFRSAWKLLTPRFARPCRGAVLRDSSPNPVALTLGGYHPLRQAVPGHFDFSNEEAAGPYNTTSPNSFLSGFGLDCSHFARR
jgi:hypothetical protein